jgi:hypothetical protein
LGASAGCHGSRPHWRNSLPLDSVEVLLKELIAIKNVLSKEQS